MQIGAITLKKFVRRDFEENIQIAGRTAAQPCLAFSSQPNARAVLHPGRDMDRKGAFARHPAAASTHFAGIVDHLTAAMTGGTGALQRATSLWLPSLACAAWDNAW